MGVSQREFAALWGKSRGAVQKAIASGRITLEADGSIDSDKALASLKDNTDPSQVREKKPVPKAALQSVQETLQESGHVSAGGNTNFVQARTANEVLKAQERKLRVQKLKGELVDRTQATSLVYQLARQERDAWQMWPTRVAATFAAEIGADTHTVQTALEKLVREHLEQLAEIKINLRS
ncbi:MAG: hypothetical protein AB7S81_00100 [Bdellovibrionales bacterium]